MPKVTELWAYVTDDLDTDDEGVAAVKTPDGWLPLIGADEARVKALRIYAEYLAKMTGKTIRLLQFAGPPREVDRINPPSSTID